MGIMAVHIRHFSREKALEVILFIADSLPDATLHSVAKMLYLADKLHLQSYGRLICGDRYIAMAYGPVPSAIYDMMKVADHRGSIDVDWDEIIQDAVTVKHGRQVVAKRPANMHVLSESEAECISQTIHTYGKKSFGELTDITHDQAWHDTDDNQPISVDAIVSTLPCDSELQSYLHAC